MAPPIILSHSSQICTSSAFIVDIIFDLLTPTHTPVPTPCNGPDGGRVQNFNFLATLHQKKTAIVIIIYTTVHIQSWSSFKPSLVEIFEVVERWVVVGWWSMCGSALVFCHHVGSRLSHSHHLMRGGHEAGGRDPNNEFRDIFWFILWSHVRPATKGRALSLLSPSAWKVYWWIWMYNTGYRWTMAVIVGFC